MKKMVSISRALKEKNRIAGRLAKAREQVGDENSLDQKVPRGINVAEMYAQSKILRDRLIAIKSAIAIANQPIVGKIIEMDEIKSEIAYLNHLNVKEGRYAQPAYGSVVETVIDAVITKAKVLEEVALLQSRADSLQDELDEFNAATKVEIEVD